MTRSRLLLAILASGLIAGLGAGVFHAIATEPLIDAAIELEALGGESWGDEPLVSRDAQRGGLFVGWVVLGLTFGGLLGGSLSLGFSRGWLPPGQVGPWLLAGAGFVAFALLPALKYPANPPGVGDPATIVLRQQAYVATWVVGLAAALLAILAAARLPVTTFTRVIAGATIFTVLCWLGLLALPPISEPSALPDALLADFRVRSLAGLALFWTLLGGSFAWFAGRAERSAKLALRPA